MISVELILLLAMLGTFIGLLLFAKLPSGLSLLAASVVGWLLSWAINGTTLELRYLIEGGFGYLDSLLVIVCAMVFIKGLQASGAMDYLTAVLVKTFKKFPTILLILFIAILMLPGMVTGSSTAGVISAGVIVTPIMLSMGMPKQKVAGFVGMGAILGMVAPPINIPVMVICDVVDIAYSGFEIPLLLLTAPMAIFSCIFFSRDVKFKKENIHGEKNLVENIILSAVLAIVVGYFVIKLAGVDKVAEPKEAKLYLTYTILFTVLAIACAVFIWLFKPYCPKIKMDEISGSVNFDILKELKWYCLIPLFVIVLLFVAQSVWPKQIGILATPLLFIIAFIPTLFTGRKVKALKAVDSAIDSSLGVMGLLVGVGAFIEIMTLNGCRGYIVANILVLMSKSRALLFVALGASMSIFGGISSFASASVFGGPFVMALYQELQFLIICGACSLIAALGEFLPPTALTSKLSTKNINDIKKDGEDDIKYMDVTKNSAVPIIVTLAWAMLFIIIVGQFFIKK